MPALPTLSQLQAQGLTEAGAQRWLHLQNRVSFAESFFADRAGTEWQVRDYQRGSLNSQAARKVHCDGRDVGKTTEIEAIAC